MFYEDDVVFRYTREEAIEDGVLVDVSNVAKEVGFRIPLVLTARVFSECVSWPETETAVQDEQARLKDVLFMAALAARAAKGRGEGRIDFELYLVPRGGALAGAHKALPPRGTGRPRRGRRDHHGAGRGLSRIGGAKERSMFTDADVIHVYTRREALNDGALMDTGSAAREAGFQVPVALTAKAWATCVGCSTDETTPQDHDGRLWDVLGMASLTARAAALRGDCGRVEFEVLVMPRGNRRMRLARLALLIGPGDQGEPVATIMTPDEE